MRSRRSTGGWSVGAVVLLVGGLVLANYGAGVTPAVAEGQAPNSGITAGWDSALPAAHRFVILRAFNGAAVLDRNTGLVSKGADHANCLMVQRP